MTRHCSVQFTSFPVLLAFLFFFQLRSAFRGLKAAQWALKPIILSLQAPRRGAVRRAFPRAPTASMSESSPPVRRSMPRLRGRPPAGPPGVGPDICALDLLTRKPLPNRPLLPPQPCRQQSSPLLLTGDEGEEEDAHTGLLLPHVARPVLLHDELVLHGHLNLLRLVGECPVTVDLQPEQGVLHHLPAPPGRERGLHSLRHLRPFR